MCGIIGYYGESKDKITKMCEAMWVLGVIRGPHSSGVALLTSEKKIKIFKEVGHPGNILYTKEYLKMTENSIVGFLGHNRMATKGKITKKNAHPFRHGNIIGMHNGTLIFERNLKIDNKEFGTDSESIIYHLSKFNIENTWKKLDGAATLVWFNQLEQSINMITNGQRPLVYALRKDNKGIFWASERWLIEIAANKSKIEIGEYWQPKPHILFTFKWDKEKNCILTLNKKLESFSWINKTSVYSGKKFKYGSLVVVEPEISKEEDTDIFEDPEYTLDNITKFPFSISLKNNISEENFYSIYGYCIFCGGSLEGEYLTSIILDDKSAACKDCSVLQSQFNIQP